MCAMLPESDRLDRLSEVILQGARLMADSPTRPAWPWLALIVVLVGAYVWWLSIGALNMAR
jgi:hypothetical protein